MVTGDDDVEEINSWKSEVELSSSLTELKIEPDAHGMSERTTKTTILSACIP